MKPLIAAMRMFFIVVRPATAQDNERADTTFKLGSHGLLELDPGDPPCPEYLADPRRARMLVGIDRAILSTLSTDFKLAIETDRHLKCQAANIKQ
jgi:hypothetical protein